MKLRGLVLVGITALPVIAAGQNLNFYLPSDSKKSEAKEEKKNAAEESKKKKAAEPEEASPEKEKPAPKPKPRENSSKKAATAKDLHLRDRKTPPESDRGESFEPPMDGFGLARAFKHRWDFSSFIMTAEEELRFRLNAARTRTLRIARAFTALSEEVETRQRNLNAAALAAYLLSRDQATWEPLGGRNLTEAQMLAVRATMRQDMNAMNDALADYETLRTSLNESAEQLAALEKNGLDGAAPNAAATADRPTLPYTAVARAETDAVLDERIISVRTLKAILATEMLSASGDRRQSIASFAPPPPQVHQATPPFAATGTEAGKNAAEHKGMKRPEQTALILPTAVNAPVHAVRDGVVAFAGPFRGYGDMVIIEHGKGTFSIYSHLGTIEVRERQPIKAGTVLGRAGTPPQLGRSGIHFQVRKGKDVVKPKDWLGANVSDLLLKG